MEEATILGSGPAGLTAAIYAARANLHPLLIEGSMSGGSAGGQLMDAGKVENFPALPQCPQGPELIRLIREQLSVYNISRVQADARAVNLQSRPFEITCSNGQQYETNALIIATGALARRLPLDSEKKFWGNGISVCAICDGGLPVFRDNVLAVIGGGDSAAEEALYLTSFGSKVLLIHRRDSLRASAIMQERVLKNPKIECLWNSTVEEFLGSDYLTGIRVKNGLTGSTSEISVQGVFEAIGHVPNTKFLTGQLDLDKSGYVVRRDDSTETSVAGVFAAGDVADGRYRQAVTAAGNGCQAAIDAQRWLQANNFLS